MQYVFTVCTCKYTYMCVCKYLWIYVHTSIMCGSYPSKFACLCCRKMSQSDAACINIQKNKHRKQLKVWPWLTIVPNVKTLSWLWYTKVVLIFFRMDPNYAEVTQSTYQNPSHASSQVHLWIVAFPFNPMLVKNKRKYDEPMMKNDLKCSIYGLLTCIWSLKKNPQKIPWWSIWVVTPMGHRPPPMAHFPLHQVIGATGCWDWGTFSCFIGRPRWAWILEDTYSIHDLYIPLRGGNKLN